MVVADGLLAKGFEKVTISPNRTSFGLVLTHTARQLGDRGGGASRGLNGTLFMRSWKIWFRMFMGYRWFLWSGGGEESRACSGLRHRDSSL